MTRGPQRRSSGCLPARWPLSSHQAPARQSESQLPEREIARMPDSDSVPPTRSLPLRGHSAARRFATATCTGTGTSPHRESRPAASCRRGRVRRAQHLPQGYCCSSCTTTPGSTYPPHAELSESSATPPRSASSKWRAGRMASTSRASLATGESLRRGACDALL